MRAMATAPAITHDGSALPITSVELPRHLPARVPRAGTTAPQAPDAAFASAISQSLRNTASLPSLPRRAATM